MKEQAVVIVRDRARVPAGRRTARALLERGLDVRLVIVPGAGCRPEIAFLPDLDEPGCRRNAGAGGRGSGSHAGPARAGVSLKTLGDFLRASRYVITI